MDGLNGPIPAVRRVTVIVPALEPDEKTLGVLAALRERGFDDILLIDDGRIAEPEEYFGRAKEIGCEVLHHGKCAGKGAALRTGFRYFLNTRRDRLGVVTVDSDGQHSAEDAMRCACLLASHPDSIVLGRRDFSDPAIPRHSRNAGRLTSFLVRIFCGLKVRDPQSGLRAIPQKVLGELCGVPGDRYEYEINLLLEAKKRSVPVFEFDIQADYSAVDRTTHFRSVLDSLRINSMFLKFSLSSLSSYLIDLLAFWLFAHFLNDAGGTLALWSVPVSTCAARVLSTVYCYLLNRKTVFHTKSDQKQTLFRYIVCAAIIMIASALGTWLVTSLLHVGAAWAQTLLKCCVDTALFFVNFRLQHGWVFAEK